MAATVQLARKLTSSAEPSAEERALVAIDTQGAVISPLRRYAGRAAVYGALSILSGIGICSLLSGDPLVLALSLVGTAAWGHGLLVTRWLEQASQLIHVARLDEAEALLLRCLRPPWGSEAVRGHAHLRLSTVASHRGHTTKRCARLDWRPACSRGSIRPSRSSFSSRAIRRCGRSSRFTSRPRRVTRSRICMAHQAATICGRTTT
jgi:hypothetical protein